MGADTVILVDRDGNVAEGPRFNVFVVKDGRLATAATGVLDGMMRRTVIELCGETNIECVLTAISPSRVFEADEVFLTTTTGGVIAVTVVDGGPIGDGKRGLITN